MKRKQFDRGTIAGGIARIAIALIAIAIAGTVIASGIRSQDPDDKFGSVFMFLIGGIMIIASVSFIGNGIKMIVDGGKSAAVSRKGHSETAKILDLTETEVTETNNGSTSVYTIYNLKFEYTDDSGNLCESKEQISRRIFEKLQTATLVPVLVYGERAVFDKNKFEKETDPD